MTTTTAWARTASPETAALAQAAAAKLDRARALIATGNWPAAALILRANHARVIAVAQAVRHG